MADVFGAQKVLSKDCMALNQHYLPMQAATIQILDMNRFAQEQLGMQRL